MPNYTIIATKTVEYRVSAVDFEDEESALASLDDWIADDFTEDDIYSAQWDYEVVEE